MQAHRQSRRISLDRPTKLITSDGVEVNVVVDLSGEGFRINSAEPLFVGEQVRLLLGRGEYVPAQLRWSAGGTYGGTFVLRA